MRGDRRGQGSHYGRFILKEVVKCERAQRREATAQVSNGLKHIDFFYVIQHCPCKE